MIVALVVLVRSISCTAAHPRIALLTSTVTKAINDFLHFLIICLVVYLGLAFVATWRFGAKREDLSTLAKTCQTMFDSLLGPPGAFTLYDNKENLEYTYFVLLYWLSLFFFMLNFILAIIVDAYAKVVEENEALEVEQSVWYDVAASLRICYFRWRKQWPKHTQLIKKIEGLPRSQPVTSVALMSLASNETKPLFKNPDHAQHWMEYYARYDFLGFTTDEPEGPQQEVLDRLEEMTLQTKTRFKCIEKVTEDKIGALDRKLDKVLDALNAIRDRQAPTPRSALPDSLPEASRPERDFME